MADSSFDIVSKIDKQEVANALNTASKEISTRYDFKGVGASLAFSGEHAVLIKANTEERALAVLDVFQTWLVKRKVSLKHLDYGGKDEKPTPRLSGKEYRLEIALKEGIDQETAKKIAKIIRDEGPKTVKSQIQGDELRVTSKSRDDLQSIQNMLRGRDLDTALQFTNYR
jgi:cyclic-di-GMP-binding protein